MGKKKQTNAQTHTSGACSAKVAGVGGGAAGLGATHTAIAWRRAAAGLDALALAAVPEALERLDAVSAGADGTLGALEALVGNAVHTLPRAVVCRGELTG